MNQVKSRIVDRDMSRKCHSKNMEKSTIPFRRSSMSAYHFCAKQNRHIMTGSHFVTYIAESNENLRKCLPANLVQTGSVQRCHLSSYCQIYQTQYMLLTHTDELLCLQLNTAGSRICKLFLGFHVTPPCNFTRCII